MKRVTPWFLKLSQYNINYTVFIDSFPSKCTLFIGFMGVINCGEIFWIAVKNNTNTLKISK